MSRVLIVDDNRDSADGLMGGRSAAAAVSQRAASHQPLDINRLLRLLAAATACE